MYLRRVERGWSQEKLAAKVFAREKEGKLTSNRKSRIADEDHDPASRRTEISALESGSTANPQAVTIRKYARALGITPGEIANCRAQAERDSNNEASRLLRASDEILNPQIGSQLSFAPIALCAVPDRLTNVGGLVTWKRMSAGTYAPRPHVLMHLLTEFKAWSETIDSALALGDAPVFWVDGRSGDGKSVALLQLAHHLLSEGPDRKLFQLATPERISDLLHFLTHAQPAQTLNLIVVDDPHRLVDTESWNQAITACATAGTLRFAFLACGTTPESKEFENRSPSTKITRCMVPSVSSTDRTELAIWFGHEDSKIEVADNSLLVEFLFELSIGEPISNFARKFGERLRSVGLLEGVSSALVANILDLFAPNTLLKNARQIALIRQMAEVDHLHFEFGNSLEVAGFRIVHGRIAWRLFEIWAMGGTSHSIVDFLAEHLATLIEAVPKRNVNYIRAVLNSIEQTLLTKTGGGDKKNDISMSILIMSKLVYLIRSNSDSRSYIIQRSLHLLNHPKMAASQRKDISEANERIIEAAKIEIEAEETKTAQKSAIYAYLIYCPLLAKHEQEMYAERFMELLAREPEQTLGALSRFAQGMPREYLDKLINWMESSPPYAQKVDAAVQIVARFQKEPRVIDLSILIAQTHEHVLNLGFLLNSLISTQERQNEVVALAVEWIEVNWNSKYCGGILSAALRATNGRYDIVALALSWVAENPYAVSSSNVFATLLSVVGGTTSVIAEAMNWLKLNDHLAGCANIFAGLIGVTKGSPEIVALALDWVDRYHHSSCGNVLQSILELSDGGGRNNLSQAMKWVSRHPKTLSCSQILNTALRVFPADVEVQDASYIWIEANYNSRAVASLLETLLKESPNSTKLISFSLDWISHNKQYAVCGNLLRNMLNKNRGHSSIILSAVEWISRSQDHSVTRDLCRALAPCCWTGNADAELQILVARRSLQWIDLSASKVDCSLLLTELLGHVASNQDLLDYCREIIISSALLVAREPISQAAHIETIVRQLAQLFGGDDRVKNISNDIE
ncbi:helix-turn-helix transcriptional regulator [Rhizobium sp. BG4]|uniref:helix-turn-helix domain-containing protein n=1 Tax=Rhizobium sp. BG4 TaxID=2613770 RepID=UPI00193D3A5C|nr:helix-turn-helix transcriptional regulator [Rhizobium sp. BG4]QRM43357.1 helix-turn-helix transcriptional regulator [Rhizobium sp. BG4]